LGLGTQPPVTIWGRRKWVMLTKTSNAMTKRLTATAVVFICYYGALFLMFSETTRKTTMAFSFAMVQRHRLIGTSSSNSWCTSHKTAISSSLIEGVDYHEDDCNGENDSNQQQKSHHLSFSRRKVISSTIPGIVAVITSAVVTPQPKYAFASNVNAATAIDTNVVVSENGRIGMAVAETIANPSFGNMDAVTLTPSGKDLFQIIKQPEPEARSMTSQVAMDDQSVVRQYAGVFLEKMLGELAAGEGREKGVEHVFRNLAIFLSPPVTALDGGGFPLARLRDGLAPGVAERFDSLSLNGARLADAILSEIPFKGVSAHDPGRVLIGSAEFDQPSKQVDAIFASIWAVAPLHTFKAGC